MIEPKDIQIETQSGVKTYVLSKFPAISGREIVTQYPISAMPRVGDYGVNEAIMMKLMSFVAVRTPEGAVIQLATRELVDNHVPDWETLAKLEMAMMEYNCSFFGNGKASTFFAKLEERARQLISSTLTDLLERSSQTDKQP